MWPFRRTPQPAIEDKIRAAAPDIAAKERELAKLKEKRAALQEEIAKALEQMTSGTVR